MKHAITEYIDSITLANLGFGAKDAEYFANLTITNIDRKTVLSFKFGTEVTYTVRMNPSGGMRFERSRRGEAVEYLQKDLVTGEVGWNSAKPYTASGRVYVEVHLGFDVVMG